ncbi:MAG: prohibitin family protein [Thermosynechococcaceae cyanobacterium]
MQEFNRFKKFPFILIALGGIGLLVALLRSLVAVPAGSVGIVDLYGRLSGDTLPPGLHFKNPLAKVTFFSTQTKELKETAQAPSKEGLMVTLDVSILYRLDPAKAREVYQTIGTEYDQVILVPQFRSLIRNSSAQFDAIALYTSQRQALSQQLRDDLHKILAPKGILVEDTPLRNVVLPENVQNSVQAKIQAEQDSERMKFVLQKERQESDRKRIEAQGTADAQRIIAQGLSDRILQFRQIEATEKLAQSQNAKIVIVGADQKSPPLILQP